MNKPSITISVNPTYFCNFDCDFCYLTKEQLNDKKLLKQELLIERLNEVTDFFSIECIDVYGGEVGLLPTDYLDQLIDTLKLYCLDINVITNLSKINPSFLRLDINLSVSWEGDIRRKSSTVLDNLKVIGRDVNLLMLAGKEMLSWSPNKLKTIVNEINTIPYIRSVEIKPYSSNQANSFDITFNAFEEHVKSWFVIDKKFMFVNEIHLNGVFEGTVNSFSDDHLYIDPFGRFNVLDFDASDNEYFKEITNVETYFDWTNEEKVKVSENSFCSKCPYLGSCLSEHLRDVKSIDQSCNGFYQLIEWFRKRQL
ncbi:MAG: MoaA/NifB/PqqE/SkfB family radical SAM enzyme [Bacteriovoracaceae bacterium]|jgi:MoaA/NifB/PqqE/SkfB family radical SAM enzyme